MPLIIVRLLNRLKSIINANQANKKRLIFLEA